MKLSWKLGGSLGIIAGLGVSFERHDISDNLNSGVTVIVFGNSIRVLEKTISELVFLFLLGTLLILVVLEE